MALYTIYHVLLVLKIQSSSQKKRNDKKKGSSRQKAIRGLAYAPRQQSANGQQRAFQLQQPLPPPLQDLARPPDAASHRGKKLSTPTMHSDRLLPYNPPK